MNSSELLTKKSRNWLVTGCAGFIGSHLAEHLIRNGQVVTGIDNFSTGHRRNIEELQKISDGNFRFVEGDIGDLLALEEVTKGVEFILHQAALGSVPRSIESPLKTHHSNVTGFLNLLWVAKKTGVARVVYASSSSVYGDSEVLPKVEDVLGKPLSPYAATKLFNEIYAQVFLDVYSLPVIGLRYFNVFGPRQDPNGPYAAVIPRWIQQMKEGNAVQIHGDGETSRDFCYVENAVDANIKAALTENKNALGRVYNVACGERITLNELYEILKSGMAEQGVEVQAPLYGDFRPGDVRHSLADISQSTADLDYTPLVSAKEGLKKTLACSIQLGR